MKQIVGTQRERELIAAIESWSVDYQKLKKENEALRDETHSLTDEIYALREELRKLRQLEPAF